MKELFSAWGPFKKCDTEFLCTSQYIQFGLLHNWIIKLLPVHYPQTKYLLFLLYHVVSQQSACLPESCSFCFKVFTHIFITNDVNNLNLISGNYHCHYSAIKFLKEDTLTSILSLKNVLKFWYCYSDNYLILFYRQIHF